MSTKKPQIRKTETGQMKLFKVSQKDAKGQWMSRGQVWAHTAADAVQAAIDQGYSDTEQESRAALVTPNDKN